MCISCTKKKKNVYIKNLHVNKLIDKILKFKWLMSFNNKRNHSREFES